MTGATGNLAFSTPPAIDASTGALTYQTAGNTNGTATVQVTLSDNGGVANGGVNTSAVQTFTITVAAVNDAPSFATLAGSPPAVTGDAGPQTVSTFATGMLRGPVAATDEAGQALAFTLQVTGTTGGLTFSTAPAIDATTGALTYQSAADEQRHRNGPGHPRRQWWGCQRRCRHLDGPDGHHHGQRPRPRQPGPGAYSSSRRQHANGDHYIYGDNHGHSHRDSDAHQHAGPEWGSARLSGAGADIDHHPADGNGVSHGDRDGGKCCPDEHPWPGSTADGNRTGTPGRHSRCG